MPEVKIQFKGAKAFHDYVDQIRKNTDKIEAGRIQNLSEADRQARIKRIAELTKCGAIFLRMLLPVC